jgi:hypothetical protein
MKVVFSNWDTHPNKAFGMHSIAEHINVILSSGTP